MKLSIPLFIASIIAQRNESINPVKSRPTDLSSEAEQIASRTYFTTQASQRVVYNNLIELKNQETSSFKFIKGYPDYSDGWDIPTWFNLPLNYILGVFKEDFLLAFPGKSCASFARVEEDSATLKITDTNSGANGTYTRQQPLVLQDGLLFTGIGHDEIDMDTFGASFYPTESNGTFFNKAKELSILPKGADLDTQISSLVSEYLPLTPVLLDLGNVNGTLLGNLFSHNTMVMLTGEFYFFETSFISYFYFIELENLIVSLANSSIEIEDSIVKIEAMKSQLTFERISFRNAINGTLTAFGDEMLTTTNVTSGEIMYFGPSMEMNGCDYVEPYQLPIDLIIGSAVLLSILGMVVAVYFVQMRKKKAQE